MRGANGSIVMPSTVTVSMWPQSRSVRPPPEPGARTTTLGRPWMASRTSACRPWSTAHWAMKPAIFASPQPPGTSDGLTESIATSWPVSSATSAASTPPNLLTQRARLEGARRRDRNLQERRRRGVALHLIDAAGQALGLRHRRQQVREVRRRQRQAQLVAGRDLRRGREDLDVEARDLARL